MTDKMNEHADRGVTAKAPAKPAPKPQPGKPPVESDITDDSGNMLISNGNALLING